MYSDQSQNRLLFLGVLTLFVVSVLLAGCDSSGTDEGSEENEITVSVQPSEAGQVEKQSIGPRRVELEAIASTGWTFKKWTGDIQATENPVVITVDQNMEVSAILDEKPTNWTLIHREGSVELSEVIFFNASTGYIFGDESLMFETQDGGESWERNTSLPSFRYLVDVDFENKSLGYIITEDPSYRYEDKLYKTTDGGETWNEIKIGPGEATLNIHPSIVHSYSEDVVFVGGSGVHMTEDGGDTWTGVQSGSNVQGISDIFFLTREVGYAIHGRTGNTSNKDAILLKTSNGGEYWREVYSWGGRLIGMDPIYFITKEKGFASDDSIIKTSDGGNSWETVLEDFNAYSFDFASNSNGIATGDEKIFRTTDGGDSWNKDNTTNIDFPEETSLHDASYVNQDVAYVVGFPGLVLKYER